jgi:hypothetical protein
VAPEEAFSAIDVREPRVLGRSIPSTPRLSPECMLTTNDHELAVVDPGSG